MEHETYYSFYFIFISIFYSSGFSFFTMSHFLFLIPHFALYSVDCVISSCCFISHFERAGPTFSAKSPLLTWCYTRDFIKRLLKLGDELLF